MASTLPRITLTQPELPTSHPHPFTSVQHWPLEEGCPVLPFVQAPAALEWVASALISTFPSFFPPVGSRSGRHYARSLTCRFGMYLTTALTCRAPCMCLLLSCPPSSCLHAMGPP